MKDLYTSPKQARPGLLAKRLMYGSDWEMSLPEANVKSYLAGFEALYKTLQHDLGPGWSTLSDDFLGRNAVEFLGLRSGEATRKRLDQWYAKNLAEPAWMRKVDAIPDRASG